MIIALIACLSAILGMLLKLCYASKCKSIKICWDCLKIERDTIHEQSLRNSEMFLGIVFLGLVIFGISRQ